VSCYGDYDCNPGSGKVYRSSRVYQATMTINNLHESKLSKEQRIFRNREIATLDQSSPTCMSIAHLEAVYWDMHRQVYEEVNREVYQQLTEMLLKQLMGSTPMKSTRWSPLRMVKDDFLVKQHLHVNAEYRWLTATRYTPQSIWKHCTELRQCYNTWNWLV